MNIKLSQTYSFCQIGERKNQEDARYPDKDVISRQQRFFVVCDGVGGSEKGEVASSTVCQSFADSLEHLDLETMDFGQQEFTEVLGDAYEALDAQASGGSQDMGTTMTFVCFHQGGCMMAHIGDSRIYQVRPGQGIVYRSEDHSLVNSMVRAGVISPEQSIDYPQNNVITRCMEPKDPDRDRCRATVVSTTDVRRGDYFLLCTDGVLHQVKDDQLETILLSGKSDQEKCNLLATLCETSSDNNTAILVHVASVAGNEQSEDSFCESSRTRILARNNFSTAEVSPVEHSPEGFWGWLKRKLF